MQVAQVTLHVQLAQGSLYACHITNEIIAYIQRCSPPKIFETESSSIVADLQMASELDDTPSALML